MRFSKFTQKSRNCTAFKLNNVTTRYTELRFEVRTLALHQPWAHPFLSLSDKQGGENSSYSKGTSQKATWMPPDLTMTEIQSKDLPARFRWDTRPWDPLIAGHLRNVSVSRRETSIYWEHVEIQVRGHLLRAGITQPAFFCLYKE